MNENFNNGYENLNNTYDAANGSYMQQPQDNAAQAVYTPQKPKKAKKKRGVTAGKIAAIAICCSILGGGLGAGGTVLGMKYLNDTDSASSSADSTDSAAESTTTILSSESRTAVETSSVSTGELMTAAEVYAQNVNSTVGITTEVTTNYFGYQTTSAASGSGFIISSDGYILTNYHVIDGASKVTVTTYSGEAYDAQLIGGDESNDIAVLKIEAEDLTPVVLGSSDDLNVGDEVVAIGNPLGELTFSLTSGVVSALDREITTTSNTTMNLIQTDCAINSGNSGGALFNMYGEVVGITNAKYSSSSSSEASIDNIGFAIPIDQVTNLVESIITDGYVVKPYIGVTVTDSTTSTSGAQVVSVTEGSPSEEAGLKSGDVITAFNGKEITSSSDLTTAVGKCSAGDVVTLNVVRSGEVFELELTVGETEKSTEIETETESEQTQQETQDFSEFFGNGQSGKYY